MINHSTRRRALSLYRVVAVAVACVAAAAGQAAAPEGTTRFAGWEGLRDPAFVFDPDARPTLGFSVRATPDARVDLAAAEALLDGGDPVAAARALQDVVWMHDDAVVQVAQKPGRWVGAGEWALYLLLTRVPESARAAASTSVSRSALADAVAWRDVSHLRALAVSQEGLPEGARAAAAAAQLLAERGAREAARAAADRARLVTPDATLDALSASVTAAAPARPAPAALPNELRPLWTEPLLVADLGPRNPFYQPGTDEAPIAPIVPVLRDGVAYVCDSLSTSAYDMLTGQRLWHHAGPIESIHLEHAQDRWFGFDKYLDNWRQRAVSPFQVAEPGVAGGFVVSAEQAAERRHELTDFDGIPIDHPLPERRLVCLDAATGAELWRQERPELPEGHFVNRLSVCGAPVIADGAVFVSGYILEGSLNAYLAAFDLANGSLLWRTFLCSGQQDLTMFNRPFQEHTPSPLLLVDGALFACTNLGVVASVDAFSGRVRWLAGYDFTPRRASRSPERDVRRDVLWVNRAPQVAAGNLIVMPLDGQQLLAFDPATGRRRWELDARRPDREFRHDALALPDGRIAVSSDDRLDLCDAATGRLLAMVSLQDQRASGPLEAAGGSVLQPCEDGILVFDPGAVPHATRLLRWDDAPRDSESRRAVLPHRVVADGRSLLLSDALELRAVMDVGAALADALSRTGQGPVARVEAGELLLASGKLVEAGAQLDAALADPATTGALRERARAARLRQALAVARVGAGRADWLALLACAERLGDPFAFAEDALIALDAVGAQDDASAALARLAAKDPGRRLTLGERSGGHSLPAGLVAALRSPAGETPAAAIGRLQGLIELWPGESWQGGTVRGWAAARISDLIDVHGRQAYASWDAQASAALARAGDAAALAEVERRFPNALVVNEARRRRLEEWLADGRARDVLEDMARPPLSGYGEEGRALRARAARDIGENGLAAALGSERLPPSEATLPALPVGGVQTVEVKAGERGRAVFPFVEGRFADALRTCLVGCLNNDGKLFVLDTATASIVWKDALPSGMASGTPGYVEMHADGDRLMLITYARQNWPDDHIETRSLRDGAPLWSRDLPGETRSAVVADGLLLRLARLDVPGEGGHFRLTGYGTCTGDIALELDVPDCQGASLVTAGGRPVLFTDGGLSRDGATRDPRLWSVDPRDGRLLGGAPLPGDSSRLMLPLDVPPTVLLSSRGTPDVPPVLMAWDVQTAAIAWQRPVQAPMLTRQVLFPAGEGRALLFSTESGAQALAGARLVPVDARLGPLPATPAGAPLQVLPGQSAGRVPRLVLARADDLSRLVVHDARTAEHLFDVVLPEPLQSNARIVHGRDGFVLVQEAGLAGGPVTIRLFDGATGAERYSGALEAPRGLGRAEVALADGAVVMAWGAMINVLRGGTR